MNKNNNIYHLEPHNFNFDATYYTNLNEEQFCIDLHQNGLVLNQEDINAWYQYLDKHKMNVKKERLKNYFNTIKEKEDLEKMLNQTTVSNNKIKL